VENNPSPAFDRSRLRGIIPPMVTPLERDGYTVSEKGVHALVNFIIDQGAHGIFVAGTTGEVAALDDIQWRNLVRYSVEAARRRVPILAGAIAPTTTLAVARARWAAELGVDVVVATTPYYYPPSQREIVDHIQAIAQATALPLLLYNIPQNTKVGMTLDTYLQLARYPQIIGLKDSAGNVTEFRQALLALRANGQDFRMLLGSDHLTDVAILIGAQGTVPSIGNIAARDLVAAYDAAIAGDWATSIRYQTQVMALTRIYDVVHGSHQTGIIVGLKCALNLMGIEVGPPAAPMRPLDAEETRQVAEILRAGGWL
jgi:4-hydroxy-tetrahydrodipicolinate synthase